MEHTGVCKYCGQMHYVKGGDNMSEEQVNEAATYSCGCDGSQMYQKAEDKKTHAIANIEKAFEGDGETLITSLKNVAGALAWGKLTKVSMVSAEGIKATLTGKEKSIKVERTEVTKTTLED